MNRRQIIKQLGALAMASAATPLVLAQSQELFLTLPNALPPEEAGKIDVIEFFHYGCPHCRNFNPLVRDWAKRLPDDVTLLKVPAIWGNEQLRGLARLYYTAERTGTLDLIEPDIFAAVQDHKLPIHAEPGLTDWLKRFEIDQQGFLNTYKSFSIQGLVQRADQLARAYRIQGVPTMAVGGQFVTSASMTGSHPATLEVVDRLIQQVRAAA